MSLMRKIIAYYRGLTMLPLQSFCPAGLDFHGDQET